MAHWARAYRSWIATAGIATGAAPFFAVAANAEGAAEVEGKHKKPTHALLAAPIATSSISIEAHRSSSNAAAATADHHGAKIERKYTGTKRYTLGEVDALAEAGRIVVGLKGKLFDVTDFTGHPGGKGRLLMAAGQVGALVQRHFRTWGEPQSCQGHHTTQ